MERGSFYGNLPLAFFKCEICFRGLGIKQIKLGVVIENLTDLLRIGLDWIGLDWIGLDWIGSDWIGLDWIGWMDLWMG